MTPRRERYAPGEIAAVGALLVLGTVLRFWHLDAGWFGVDQARDIQTGLDIAAGDAWPTVGPTMRRVTSLGALYYYFWALPFLVSADPLAAYRFAAGLGVATLLATWAFARRFWGAGAGIVALAVLATAPVAVIDARVAWAPAALPLVAIVLLWLLVGPSTPFRLCLLGATLGLAIQLHLAMVAWCVAAGVLVVARRPSARALAAGGLAFAVVAAPALYAALANAGHDAGLATLPGRGPAPDLVGRAAAVMALGWRVRAAFWQWPDAPDDFAALADAAGVVTAIAGVVGLVRLGRSAARGRRAAGVVLLALLVQVAMVLLLPGEAWYYYLDGALPAYALAAGALFASSSAGSVLVTRARQAGLVIVVAATVVLAAHHARWIAQAAHHGYVALDPVALALDGTGGRDAAEPGRLVSAGMKRTLADGVLADGGSLSVRWHATHGPAFDDVTGDNGFWLARAAARAGRLDAAAPIRHGAVWYRDDPSAPSAPSAGGDLAVVGPFTVVRYAPSLAYDTCRDERGPVAVPIRVVPAPRRYGDGTIARASTLPARIDCAVAPGPGGTLVVAAVTSGTVTLRAAGVAGPTASTSTLCVRRGDEPAPFTIETSLPAGAAADLDLYERPDLDCAAGKIAP